MRERTARATMMGSMAMVLGWMRSPARGGYLGPGRRVGAEPLVRTVDAFTAQARSKEVLLQQAAGFRGRSLMLSTARAISPYAVQEAGIGWVFPSGTAALRGIP